MTAGSGLRWRPQIQNDCFVTPLRRTIDVLKVYQVSSQERKYFLRSLGGGTNSGSETQKNPRQNRINVINEKSLSFELEYISHKLYES